MPKNDGGPAFPLHGFVNDDDTVTPHTRGMTLRDYFAGQAMLGFIASNSTGDIARASVVEAEKLLAALREDDK